MSRSLGNPYEYLRTAREVGNVHTLLETYVDRIPYAAEDNWPTHVAGHPPGTLLFFVGLVKVGLGGDLAAGVVVTVLAASTAAAVLVTLRALDAEEVARRAAPFLVLTPAAVFMAVSADALIAAVMAWGLACLALADAAAVVGGARGAAAGLRRGDVLRHAADGAGRARGAGGRTLVAAAPGRGRGGAGGGALVRVRAASRGGTPTRCCGSATTTGSRRTGRSPTGGTATWPASSSAPGRCCCRAGARPRPPVPPVPLGCPLLLVGATVVAIAIADVSGMSKAEVERIWLPFVPWLTVSFALLPDGWRRWGLAAQVVAALLVQHLFYTAW